MDMQNYTTPFANTGDREDFSIGADPSGKVSLEKGFTELYQLKPEEGGLFILRKVFNQMMKLVSTDTVTWKTQSFPNWIEDKGDGLPYAYPKNAIVKYTNGNNYVSLVDNNTQVPTGANWKLFDITALDNTVKLSGNQTIAGVKTFSANPISSAVQSTAVNALTRKDYVDGLASANVKLTGNQTIGGVKTFSSTISGSIDGNSATATKLVTARTINGVNFDGTADIVAPTNLTVGTRTTTAVPINSSTGTNASIPAATTALAGVMSSADKVKLNGIAAGAQVNVATNLDITAGTTAGPIVTSSTGTNATLPTASASASGVVTTGNQTWAGVKTFSSSPIVPTPTTGTQAVNKNYVDGRSALPIGTILNGYTIFDNCIVAFGGEFNRADYPKLWAYLQANPSLVKTQAQWTTENTTNGMCGYFSSGDGTTTFRVPNLDKAFLRPDSRTVGSFQGDEFKSHSHSGYFGGSVDAGSSGGLAISTNYPLKSGYIGSTGGIETRPKNIAVLPLIVAK